MQRGWTRLGPRAWSAFVHKRVKVTLTAGGGEETHGWLLTVDPVSASLVLVTFGAAGGAGVQVVMGHAVQAVEVEAEADPETLERLRTLFLSSPAQEPDPERRRRRRRSAVRRWLEKNLVPVEEDGEDLLVAGGALTLTPPYGPDDCLSANQMVLDRVRSLLGREKVRDQEASLPDGAAEEPE